MVKKKNIIITGASEGIGRELCKLIANDGHNLYMLARNSERLASLKEELSTSTNKIHFISCDVSDYDQCKAAYDIVKGEFGSIDIAILNAGIGLNSSLSIPHREVAINTMGINYFGIVNFGHILFPYFREKGSGEFIGVSSMADVRGFEGSGIYCSSKSAASTYLESARAELRRYGVRVMTIKPGFVDTNMTKKNKHPMPFIMDATKAARLIYKAINGKKNSYSFPWQTRFGSYLLSILPDTVYDKLATLRGDIGQ
ncbi:MAG: SDR family NAD(P)-dependent oxidoreductase [Ignavibacteriae bacterium]|nr:SDR family NAD(P)-dependent oxidoreductase [Ignavibacteriota bacterium]MCB9221748.1 SDR family NAD(P)-dependent oxidoreductase [Ignavibacteria bacterium]